MIKLIKPDKNYLQSYIDAFLEYKKYNITNYNFSNPIVKQTDISIPTAKFEKLPAGQYFMRVTATNESGEKQYAFDYYRLELGKVYGTKSFYVDKNGKIAEDTYAED